MFGRPWAILGPYRAILACQAPGNVPLRRIHLSPFGVGALSEGSQLAGVRTSGKLDAIAHGLYPFQP